MDNGLHIASQQFSDYVAEHGGASMNMATGQMAQGPGFMVAHHGAETKTPGSTPTPGDIQDFADKHYPSVQGNREAHLGAWGNVLDVSEKASIGSEARRLGRVHLQEATYALGSASSPSGTPTRVSSTETTDTLNRPYGADVLLSLGRTPKAEREAPRVVGEDGPRKRTTTQVPKRPDEDTPIYRDMADPSVQADSAWARSKNANDFNLNEVDNDAWSMTNRQNRRVAQPDGTSKRTGLGNVLRTINRGRTNEARGAGLTVNPSKGWHPVTAGPSKVRSSQFERTPVAHSAGLESERATPRGDENAEYFHNQVLGAVEQYEAMQKAHKARG